MRESRGGVGGLNPPERSHNNGMTLPAYQRNSIEIIAFSWWADDGTLRILVWTPSSFYKICWLKQKHLNFWTPPHWQNLLDPHLNNIAYLYFSGDLYYIRSTVNPILYNSNRLHSFIFNLCTMIVHTLKMCTRDAGPEQSFVLFYLSKQCIPW